MYVRAVSGSDYTLLDASVVFGVGAASGAQQPARLAIMEDEILEGDHDFTVSIAQPSTYDLYTVGSPGSIVVTIDDSDDGKNQCTY